MQKRFLFLIILPMIVSTSCTQTPSNYQFNYCTYLGGNHFEQARDLAIDHEGNIYVVGGTSSPNFPVTPGAYNTTYNNAGSATVGSWGPMMAFVSKFSPQGKLLWSTYVGGPNYDRAYAVEVDKEGYVYIGGRAGAGLPTTPGVVQEKFIQKGTPNGLYGHQNGFIAKLSPDGSKLIWASYYGSDSYGFFRDIDIDDEGYVYGILNAVATPPTGISPDGFDPTHNGNYDMVAVKFSPDASKVIWASFLGGAGDDQGGPTIRVGPDKSVYVAGSTQSANFPLSTNAIQTQRRGAEDMYVTRIAPDGKSLIYSTYFGGNSGEFSETHCLFVDHLGQAYVACGTSSNDISTTPGALKAQRSGTDIDGLFFKLSTDGSKLLACTYFGGNAADAPEGLYVDSLQRLYVGGGASSDGLPVSANAYRAQRQGGNDGFVVQLNPDFSKALYCSYFGGTKNESVRAFHVADNGDICISGQTMSTNLPVTANAFQSAHASPNNNQEDSYLTIFKKSLSTAVKESAEINKQIQVFPNPGTAQVFVEAQGTSIKQLYLLDELGRELLSSKTARRLDTGGLPAGMYLLKVVLTDGQVLVKKWVKGK